MNDDIRAVCQKVLHAWYTGVKNAKLYAVNHPSFQQGAQRLRLALEELFRAKVELNVQHSDALFRIDDQLFIEESLTMYELLHLLEDLKISRVLFLPGITDDEIGRLLNHLLITKDPAGAPFHSDHIRIFLESVKELGLDGRQRSAERVAEIRAQLASWLPLTESVFTRVIDEQALSMADLAEPLDELIDSVHRHPSIFSMVLPQAQGSSLNVQHAINAMVISIYLGQRLGLEVSLLKLLALSALCHDIGRHFLPSEFTTGYRLKADDPPFVEIHARDGASFLSGIPGLPMTVVRVALEHHVGFNGAGYPELPSGHAPHVFSRIVGLASFMSWATVGKSYYHRPTSPWKLVRAMIRRAGTQFDPLLVKLLVPFFGLYPSGTMLRMASAKSAVSLEPNTRNIQRPAIGYLTASSVDYRWISELTHEPGEPFHDSVSHPQGTYADMPKLFDSIPNLFQTES